MGATAALSEFLATTASDAVPDEALESGKLLATHVIGAAIAAPKYEELARTIIDFTRSLGGKADSTVIGGGFRTNPVQAAFANAALGHALEFDDSEPSGHPTCMMIAAAMALGETQRTSGRDLLAAMVMGIEVYDRIAGACPDARSYGWHGTAVYGTMGAAAVAARVLKLGPEAVARAFGLAASSASGLARQRGTMVKPLQVGNAARNGVQAALLARQGVTANLDIIESNQGMCHSFLDADSCDYDKMVSSLGSPYHVTVPGVGLKTFPCNDIFFFAVSAIIKIMSEQALSYDMVDRVVIQQTASQRDLFTNSVPQTSLEAKFSFNFVCAAALLDQNVTFDTFSADRLQCTEIRDAIGKVEFVVNSEIPTGLDFSNSGYSPVTIYTKDGRSFSDQIEAPLGHARNPLSRDQVSAIFLDTSGRVLGTSESRRALDILLHLEDAQDIGDLMSVIRGHDA